MPLPVKLSDALVLDARLEGELQQRSIGGQVEYWAKLGKLLDAYLDGRKRSEVLQQSGSKPLSELIASVGTPEGGARLTAVLEREPFPHFKPHPNRRGVFIQTEADGSQYVGRFVDRKFVREETKIEKSIGSVSACAEADAIKPGRIRKSSLKRKSAIKRGNSKLPNLHPGASVKRKAIAGKQRQAVAVSYK